jgi:hypothetical protein
MVKWSIFATVAGGAAAGLTGLLFVAVSIRVGIIAKSQELRNRAAETLALFTSVLLLIAGLLLVFGLHAGLDVLVLLVLVALAGGVTSAWLLLTKIQE